MNAFNETRFISAAMRTARVSRWELLLARLFGERVEGADDQGIVVMRLWRGKLYFIKHTPIICG